MTKTQGLWVGLCVNISIDLSYVLCMMSYNNIINLLLYTCMYMYMSCINTQDSGTHNKYLLLPGPNLPGMIRLGNSRVIHPNLPKYLHGTKNVSHECSYNIAL